MGIILARFRKKKTTVEELEKLDTEIKSIEEYGKNTENAHKKIAGRFVLISVFVYVVTALIFYFYFFPESLYERVVYVLPLIAAPLVIVCVKRLLTWWYNRKLKRNYKKLSSLKDKKKEMIEKVKETETYKVAKSILEKFAPDEVTAIKSPKMSENINSSPILLKMSATPGLRYRGTPMVTPAVAISAQKSRASFSGTQELNKFEGLSPVGRSNSLAITNSTPMLPNLPMMMGMPRLPMERSILPRNRTTVDKLVDYLVGDGPNKRYALICRSCASHNGMALGEEFEFISFRCCYCYTFNPARKQKPAMPGGDFSPMRQIKAPPDDNYDTSDAEKLSESDSDSENQTSKKSSTVTITEIKRQLNFEDTDDVEDNYIVSEEDKKEPEESDNSDKNVINKIENTEVQEPKD